MSRCLHPDDDDPTNYVRGAVAAVEAPSGGQWRVWGPVVVERSQPGHRSGTGSPVAPVSVSHLACDTVNTSLL